MTTAMGFVDAASDVGVVGNDFRAVDDNRFDDFAGETVTDMGVFDADVLIDADGQLSASGDGEADRRRRLCRSSGCSGSRCGGH